ncbi:MAG: efflux RND transporter periplasmic adaptor subunit [Planctomycetota bacterium]
MTWLVKYLSWRSIFVPAAVLGLAWCTPKAAWAQWGPTPVQAVPVVARDISESVTIVGTVMPLRQSTVGSPSPGRVVAFPVNEGDPVEEGQVLAQLRTTNLEISLAQARAELELRLEELKELENGTRPEVIDQARARMEAAQALRDWTKTRLERTRALFEEGGITSQDKLDEDEAAALQAERSFLAAQFEWKLAVNGPRAETIAQARARLKAQEEQVHLLEDELSECTIRAPFDAFIVVERTEVGQWLSRGDPVVDIVELDLIEVHVSVLEDYISRLHIGAPAKVKIMALPQETFAGQVALIIPKADQRSREFPVKVRVANRPVPEGKGFFIKAGMTALVTLSLGEPHRALLVPKDAVVLGGPQPLVCVVDAGASPGTGVVRHVPVTLGLAEDDLLEVSGDLAEGAQVVTRGNERLIAGQEVVVMPPEGAPPPAGARLPAAPTGRGQ